MNCEREAWSRMYSDLDHIQSISSYEAAPGHAPQKLAFDFCCFL